MNEEIAWTKKEQTNALAAIDIMKAYMKGDAVVSGPKVLDHAQKIGTEGVIAGLMNLNAILARHVADLTGDDMIAVFYTAEDVAKAMNIKE